MRLSGRATFIEFIMAALVLSIAGAAAGGSALGQIGAMVGRLVGAVAGNLIDRALLGPRSASIDGPRLADLTVMASTEGASIPRVYGRTRLSGQVIWATNLEEVVSTTKQSGGKGMGGILGPTATPTTYSYFANFAVGLCEGPIGAVMRVLADGKPLDLTGLTAPLFHRLAIISIGAEHAEARRLVVERAGLVRLVRRRIGIVHEKDRVAGEVAADPARVFLAHDGAEIVAVAQALRLFLVQPDAQDAVASARPDRAATTAPNSSWCVRRRRCRRS